MRNISAALTKEQMRNRTKFVTRRDGWKNLKVGELLQVCEKCQGIKKGEQMVKICVIRVTGVRREKLIRILQYPNYGFNECKLEGFPDWNPIRFLQFFCETHKGCTPQKVLTRIEFEYV